MQYFIFLAISLVAFGCAASSIHAQNNQSNDMREAARKVMMPVVYRVAGTDKVKVVANIKYAQTANPNILMDFYLPPGAAKPEKRPAVIFIHGAAKPEWTAKDWGVYASWGRLIAASGMVGVTFTHRLESANKSLENAGQDLTDAIKSVRANADRYDIDKDRICLMAFSAGGSLLNLPMRGEMPFVKCVVGFYALMDVRQSDFKKFEAAETLEKFSAITYLEKDAGKLPPMFIARAGLDAVPGVNDSIDRFVSAAIAKNTALAFMNHPNGIHSFDNQTDDEKSREIIRAAIEFIRKHTEKNSSVGQ